MSFQITDFGRTRLKGVTLITHRVLLWFRSIEVLFL
jgi:hypothetical protein